MLAGMTGTTSEQRARAERGQVDAPAAWVYEEFFVPALFAAWTGPLLDAAGAQPGDRVLDVGCGTGVLARAAAARVGPAGHVVGLDPNDGMLAVARTTSDAVQWRAGTAEALPFADASFDRVVSQFALMFFADRAAGLAQMARVLRPGGRLALATWASLPHVPGYAALVELLDEVVGDAAAAALGAPFSLGDPGQLHRLVAAAFDDVRVARRHGVARFPSVDSWVRTDVCGWTLAGMVTKAQSEALLAAAPDRLARFTAPDGTVELAAPALVVTAAAGSRSPSAGLRAPHQPDEVRRPQQGGDQAGR
jgi:SAM-dependent methyltransferase